MSTNKERLQANNDKIEGILALLKRKEIKFEAVQLEDGSYSLTITAEA